MRHAFILLLTLVCGVASAQVLEANLVSNPGVELGQDSPTDWGFSSWKSSQGQWDDTVSFRGEKSLRLSGLNGGWSTSIEITPGALHRLTLRYRQQGGNAKVVTYIRDPKNPNNPLLYRSEKAIPANQKGEFVDGQFIEGANAEGWVLLDAGSFVPREDVRTVSLLVKQVGDQPSATMWLDDFQVTATIEAPLPRTDGVLQRVSGATVWTENANRKILVDQLVPSERKLGSIALDLARGEVGAFQVAVTPVVDWSNVDWKWSGLSGPATITASQLSCRLIEYVMIDDPLKPFGLAGSNPDPLTNRLPCKILANHNQSFWFTLRVPEHQSAGTYTGSMELLRNGNEVAVVPIEVKVRDFALPTRPSIDVVARMHAQKVMAAESGDDEAAIQRYYRSYFDHRTRCSVEPTIGTSIKGDQVTVNADRWIEHLRLVKAEFGVRPFFIPAIWIGHEKHRMPVGATWKGRRVFADETLSRLDPEFQRLFTSFLSQLIEKLKAADLFDEPAIRFIDEPVLSDEPTAAGIRALADLIRSIDPTITISLTTTVPHRELFSVIDQWVLHTDAWDRGAAEIAEAKQAGCKISVYNNAIAFVEQERIRIRMWPWLLKKYDVDGTYSWCGTTNWRGDMQDPWNCRKSYFEVMFYPPRDETEQGPIESVRWELLRQGLQDYEYLHLAESLVESCRAKGAVEAAALGQAAIDEAFGLVEKWPRVRPANDRPYCREVIKFEAARRRLADAIESMKTSLLADRRSRA